jgi:dipeptidyl aminopeptidase/acylaminoacyl peptidase
MTECAASNNNHFLVPLMKNKILMSLASMILPYSIASVALIPREELFQRPSCMGIKISPNAERLAYIGADKDGTTNLYITSDLSLEDAKKITNFKEPDIKNLYWLPDNKTILLLKDKDGTGYFRLYSVDLDSFKIVDITADYDNINCKVFHISQTECKAVIGINYRNPRFHDLYLLDLTNQTLSNIYENDQFINFVFDKDLELIIKIKMNNDSSITLMDKEDNSLLDRSAEDAFHTQCLQFNKEDKSLYLLDNLDTNTTQLKKIYLDGTHKEVVLGHDVKSDITDVYFENNEPLAYSTYFTHQEWHPLSKKLTSDINHLISKINSDFEIMDKSYNNECWILKNSIPDQGIEFFLYDRLSKELSLLFSSPKTKNLSKMYPLVIRSRDGLNLVSYLTLPKEVDVGGKPKKPLPLVIIPHGGPFQVRDCYEYDPYHQWLANRGYAVLSVNFRLSSGFGKDFVNAGNGQWGKKAHEDILDAIKWCIDSRIAESGKIAVFGGSYGGYEALASLTFSPDTFACAIAICAPSNLKTVLDSVPFYWERSAPVSDKMRYYTKNAFIKSMGGDPDKESEIPYLQNCSPLNYVDKIEKPLLLAHGMNDPIVISSESDQIFEKMQQKDLPVLYLSFPDEGHGITKFSNSMCYLSYSEWFLAQILGGYYEPITEEQLQLSSASIRSNGISHQEITQPLNNSLVR